MILKLRQRMAQEESGFTLVELLVVMLILGLLAAIAIPAFFNQRDKAKDASAKEQVRTAETAMETFATDHGGKYTGAGPADLINIEPTLNNVNGSLYDAAGDNTYSVMVKSSTGNYFLISRASNGDVSLKCSTSGDTTAVTVNTTTGTGTAGCPSGGDWSQG